MLNSRSTKARLGKLLALITLFSVSAFLFAACSGGQMTAATPAPAPTTAPEPTKAAAPASAAMTTTTAMTTSEAMTASAAMTTSEAMTSAATGATMEPIVMLHEDATLGNILVDAKGMTLYIFDKDEAGKSNCTADCVQKWPLLTVKDEAAQLTAGEGVTGKLGVITRDDGAYQVTINDMPLYYYAKDANPGDTTGQGVGEVWWVVGADGAKISK